MTAGQVISRVLVGLFVVGAAVVATLVFGVALSYVMIGLAIGLGIVFIEIAIPLLFVLIVGAILATLALVPGLLIGFAIGLGAPTLIHFVLGVVIWVGGLFLIGKVFLKEG